MKPAIDGFAVVTATTNPERCLPVLKGWLDRASYRWPLIVVVNGPAVQEAIAAWGAYAAVDAFPGLVGTPLITVATEDYSGVVPAFAKGLHAALGTKAEVIACLHDDVEILDAGWDAAVISHFQAHPTCGLAGFGGATQLGVEGLYDRAYDPMSLVRADFVSNMRDAEAHGRRAGTLALDAVGGHRAAEVQAEIEKQLAQRPIYLPERCVCFDGFSQIGRRAYWQGYMRGACDRGPDARSLGHNLFTVLADLGIVHHAYDAALGCYARRLGWEAWMLPVACHHHGGVTAVGDAGYQAWAKTQDPDGDQGFWKRAHRLVYDEFRDVLPLRLEGS